MTLLRTRCSQLSPPYILGISKNTTEITSVISCDRAFHVREHGGEWVGVHELETMVGAVNTSCISGFYPYFPSLSAHCSCGFTLQKAWNETRLVSFNCVKECRTCKLTLCIRTEVAWDQPFGKFNCFERGNGQQAVSMLRGLKCLCIQTVRSPKHILRA
jgi:hypothetical protein